MRAPIHPLFPLSQPGIPQRRMNAVRGHHGRAFEYVIVTGLKGHAGLGNARRRKGIVVSSRDRAVRT